MGNRAGLPHLGPEGAGGALGILIGLVREHTGIALNERTSLLLERRLRPRLRSLSLSSYDEYLALLQRGGHEVQHFIDIVTPSDSLFFRTPAVWDYVEHEFLPAWHRAHPGQCLRGWSAATASGEEAYSMAMLCDQFQQRHRDFRYRIWATDINTAVLRAATAAIFTDRSLEGMAETRPALLSHYFRAVPNGHVVVPELRAQIQFGPHNLLEPLAPPQAFHLVFLRNVLIYFDEAHQRRVLDEVLQRMAPDARLVLGEQESASACGAALVRQQEHVYALPPADQP